jgi:diguanylate cyclase (GGDEF)-like protein/PAS domain S-box-containing protein
MLGYPENERWSGPEDWFRHIHEDDRDHVRAAIAGHCKGATPEFVSEYRMRHKSGRYIWTLTRGLAVRGSSGEAIRMAGSQTDITEGKIADPLTGIPNRLYFLDRLASAMESARQNRALFAVLFVDLDQFKLVNDSLGHAAGDELLIEVAGRLRSSIRTNSRREPAGQSVVARLGGDEFAVLIDNMGQESDASVVAARVLERLNDPFHFEGRRIFVSASIGIAFSSSGVTPEDLLRNADTAMYRAKIRGKARFEFFNEGLREQVISRFETETGLRRALDAEQLILYYQPIVSMIDGRIQGFEALVRWNHPERGMIPPGEFIAIAEESDLILLLGRWVLRESCRQLAEWKANLVSATSLTVNVNVSSRQLSDARLMEDVETALADSGLDPGCLALEITESSIMGNGEQTLATLDRLKKMGVRLQIDDFGTGYSSLSYLQRLPFDALKIDRSFIRDLGTDVGSVDILKAILALARSLKLEVIAEGVETKEQLAKLRHLGCNLFQGFLFSKPVDPCAAKRLCIEVREKGFPSARDGDQLVIERKLANPEQVMLLH